MTGLVPPDHPCETDCGSSLPGNENERARHIRLHERVNALPDPNYSTLKYLMGHLHRLVTPPFYIAHFSAATVAYSLPLLRAPPAQ